MINSDWQSVTASGFLRCVQGSPKPRPSFLLGGCRAAKDSFVVPRDLRSLELPVSQEKQLGVLEGARAEKVEAQSHTLLGLYVGMGLWLNHSQMLDL